ncbi:MAG: hypothetical protein KJZ64_05775 [Sphingomonadaceae bacterium]|nr:hypothetical protein [Sphingomonadaceae bacterium]
MNAPVNLGTNLPALLDTFPPDSAHPPQTGFSRDKQVAFISALASSGAARRAVRAAGISHQTAYRMRRANPAFRLAWDAAMLAARAVAEDVLAVRAIEGVEEKVFYHGEEVATRRRFDSRLLLAHLARLDRLTANAAANAFAEDFEAALERFARGEDQPEVAGLRPSTGSGPQPERTSGGGVGGDISSPGQCNKRSMSGSMSAEAARADARAAALAAIPCGCPGAVHGTDGGRPHWRMGAQGPEPVVNLHGEGPCCETPQWPQCRDCPHYSPVMRMLETLEEARPADAPQPHELGDADAVEEAQYAALLAGAPDWWRMGAGGVLHARSAYGTWWPEDELEEDELEEDEEEEE